MDMSKIGFLTIVATLASGAAFAQPFAQPLDSLPKPSGCSGWYLDQLRKFDCTPELIDGICSGRLPHVTSGPYCGGLLPHDTNIGKTCHTMMGECRLDKPASLGKECYCWDVVHHQFSGQVGQP